jgi:hypothetical protein
MRGARRSGLGVLVSGVVAQALAMIAAAAGAEAVAAWLGVIGTTASLVGALVMGAARDGKLSRSAIAATVTVAVMLLGGLAAALLLPPESANGPLWLGLPRRAAILLVGIGIVPALVLPACYALDFPRGSPRRDAP